MRTAIIRGFKVHLSNRTSEYSKRNSIKKLANGQLQITEGGRVRHFVNFFDKCHDWENDPH